MRHDDPRADNLLLRLGSYTPRVGRDALEDFCTEALAWCLRNSKLHLKLFLERLRLPGLEGITDLEMASVSTQFAWHEIVAENSDDDEEEDEGGPTRGGRFDLVIEHLGGAFVIVVESKRSATIGEDQIDNYRQDLTNSKRFRHIPRRFLVGLTNYPGQIKGLDAQIKWSSIVTDILSRHDGLDSGKQLVFEQFEHFLHEKGLGPMKLEKVVGRDVLNAWRSVRTIQDQLEKILMAARAHEELQGKVKFKPHAEFEGSDWYGVSNSGSYIYLGFRFVGDPPNAKMYLFIERSLHGDHRTRSLSDSLRAAATEARELGRDWPEFSGGETIFAFAKEVDEHLDGNPEAIVRWFVDTCKEVLALGE